jgi:hypothetical protein
MPKPAPAKNAATVASPPAAGLAHRQLLLLTASAAVFYFLYGFASNGFYQHDEAAHYLSMRGFWHDPASVLSNWAKPGYKLLYALPALGGTLVVQLFNALVAALTCYCTARLAMQLGLTVNWVAFALLALQPFWLQLSFRNYSELPSALILVLAVLLHYRGKLLWAALVFSYIALIRQELYPVIALYGLYLLYRKQWLPALALAVFPLLHNVWGWTATADPLYLYHALTGTSEAIKDAWPRQGGDHYFLMALTVFGAVALTLFLCYLLLAAARKLPMHWFVVVPAVLYFLAHVAFNVQSVKLGPSTGGNLRYLTVIAPLLSVLGALALQAIADMKDKRLLYWLFVPWLLVVAVFLTYENNLIVFTEERDWKPLLMALIACGILLLPLSLRQLNVAVLLAVIFCLVLTVKPIKLSEEDRTVQQVAKWGKTAGLDQKHVLAAHTMFYYFWGKDAYEYNGWSKTITDSAVAASPAGTVILWDSHYSYRPQLKATTLNLDYFTQRPQQFTPLREFISRDQRFGVIAFEKK